MISFDSPRDGNKIPLRTWMTFLDRIDGQQLAIDSSVSRGMSHVLAGSCNSPIAIAIRHLFKCYPCTIGCKDRRVRLKNSSAAKETSPFSRTPPVSKCIVGVSHLPSSPAIMVFATATCSPVGSPVDRSDGNDGNVCGSLDWMRCGADRILFRNSRHWRDVMDITPTISYKMF